MNWYMNNCRLSLGLLAHTAELLVCGGVKRSGSSAADAAGVVVASVDARIPNQK